jgi:hypothetical protein
MKKCFSVFFFFYYCSFTIPFYGQNKLDKSKKELNSNSGVSSQSSSSTTNSSPKRSANPENVNVFVQIVGYATYGIFKYGFVGDYTNENHLYSNVTPYPYYNGKSGNYEKFDADTIKKNQFRIDFEDRFIYSNNDLFGNHLNVKIRPFQYFYLQNDFHQLYEINKIDHSNNRLSLFHFNIGYDRIRFEKFNFGFTIGASYVGNEVKKAGFSYGINTEYFMNNRISFLATAKWSTINGLPVNLYELQSKIHRKKFFFSTGFEHLKIASPTYNFITLGGGIYF